MLKLSAWFGYSLCAAGMVAAIAGATQTRRLIFLSTQLRPIEEAQKMRNVRHRCGIRADAPLGKCPRLPLGDDISISLPFETASIGSSAACIASLTKAASSLMISFGAE